MKWTQSLFPVAVLSLSLALAARGQEAGQAESKLPSQDDIQKLVDGGQYQDALKAIAQVLPGLGLEPSPSAKRYALYMLRGEALLQQKMSTEAISAYASAVRDAPRPADAAIPDAMQLLIKRSSAFTYTPKALAERVPPRPAGKTAATKPFAANPFATTKPATTPAAAKPADVLPSGPPPADTPLDILDHKQRAVALVGLFYDLLVPDSDKFKEVKADSALQPTIDFAPTLHTLAHVEIAATTTDAYTAAMNDQLATHAHDLMTKALAAMSSSVDGIARSANQSVSFTIPVTTGSGTSLTTTTKTEYRKHGLNGADSAGLADTVATCNKIDAAVKTLTAALNAPQKTFAPLVTQADAIRQKATSTLNANYSQTYTTPPR